MHYTFMNDFLLFDYTFMNDFLLFDYTFMNDFWFFSMPKLFNYTITVSYLRSKGQLSHVLGHFTSLCLKFGF